MTVPARHDKLCGKCAHRIKNRPDLPPCAWSPRHPRLADARRLCEGRYWAPLAPPPPLPAPDAALTGLTLTPAAQQLWDNIDQMWSIISDDDDVLAAAELIRLKLATTSWTGDCLRIEKVKP